MMLKTKSIFRRAVIALAAFTMIAGWGGSPAQARFFIGLGFPYYGPGYYPPPLYYPPPYYYPPPPAYYTPPPPVYYTPPAVRPGGTRFGGVQSCYADPYVCPMERPIASGGRCYCRGNNGQRVWGYAN